jgi:hypothetical protein
MPVEITDIDGGRGVRITGTGIVTGDEYLDVHRQHLTEDPVRFREYRHSLSDYRGATKIEIPTPAIHEVARLCREAAEVNPEIVVALLVETDLAFGLSRMWQALVDEVPWEVQVFRRADEAREWIVDRVRTRWGIIDLRLD